MTLKATKEETKTIEAVNCPACGGRAVGRWKQYVPDGWVVVCRRNKCHMSSDVGRIKQKTLYDAIETWNIYVGYLKRGEKLEEAKQEKDGLLPVICPECGDSPLMTGSTETGFKVECDSYSCKYTDGMPGCVMVNTEYEAIEDWNNQARLIKYRERYVCESKDKEKDIRCATCGNVDVDDKCILDASDLVNCLMHDYAKWKPRDCDTCKHLGFHRLCTRPPRPLGDSCLTDEIFTQWEPKPAPKPNLEPLPCPRCGSGAQNVIVWPIMSLLCPYLRDSLVVQRKPAENSLMEE